MTAPQPPRVVEIWPTADEMTLLHVQYFESVALRTLHAVYVEEQLEPEEDQCD